MALMKKHQKRQLDKIEKARRLIESKLNSSGEEVAQLNFLVKLAKQTTAEIH